MQVNLTIKTGGAALGLALLTSAATFLTAQPASAMPKQGAAALAGILADTSFVEPVQYRYGRGMTARRAAVTTRRVYRRTVRRAAVVAAVPAAAAVTVQPGTFAAWSPFRPFWWTRPGLYAGYGSYPGYGSTPAPGSYASAYASAAIPAAAITRPARLIRIGNWVRPREFWWQPGGAIAAGVAWTAWPAASASPWVGTAPDQGLCWYRTSPFLMGWNGFWDVCTPGTV